MKKIFNSWGPKIPVDTNNGLSDADQHISGIKDADLMKQENLLSESGYSPESNVDIPLEGKTVLPPTIKITYGLRQVALGFALMIVLNITVAIGFIVWELKDNLQEAINDPTVIDDALNSVISNPMLVVLSSLTMYLGWLFAISHAAKRGFKKISKTFRVYVTWKDVMFGLLFAVALRLTEMVAQSPFQYIFDNQESNAEQITSYQGIWYFINAILIATILAPIFEELFFRGLFLSAMLRKFANWRKKNKGKVDWIFKSRYFVSVAVTAVAFGSLHYPGGSLAMITLVLVETSILGTIFAIMALKTKRLGLPIFTHIFFNLTGVILATLSASS